MRHVVCVQYNEHAHGPVQLRLQHAGLRVEQHDAHVRGQPVRGRQFVVLHRLCAMLELRDGIMHGR